MSLVTDTNDVSKPSDLVQGTLDPLLLKILASAQVRHEGWIAAEWKTSDLGRRAKFYSLTRLGRRQLASESANWERLSCAITSVVKPSEV